MLASVVELMSAILHPSSVLGYLQYDKRIAQLTGCDRLEVRRFLEEVELKGIEKHVIDNICAYRKLILGPSTKPRKPQVYYAILRLMKPDVVAETGVQAGVSTAYILQALRKNGSGVLYSLDLPDEDILRVIPTRKRKGLKSGWLVPESLRARWHLTLGRSQEKLPLLLQELGQIDIFIHDSEHSYENMLWEYRMAWKHLRRGGALLSDDTNLNDSFSDFAREQGVKPIPLVGPLCGIRKRPC